MLLVTTNTIANVSGVETEGVGVYWDSECNNPTTLIDWETLTPGSAKSVVVYIQNEVDESRFLYISTKDWDPENAFNYLSLRWKYTGQRIDPGDVLQTTLTLYVSRYIEGISSFSFLILVTGSDRLLGDVDGDGIVNIFDVKKVKLALAGCIVEPGADIDGDGKVTTFDLKKVKVILAGYVL
jgi:hypothetical protein